MTLRSSSLPTYIGCDWKVIAGKTTQGENLLTTDKAIMGHIPVDAIDVLVIQPKVCAGKTVPIDVFSSPASGRGLLYATDGTIVSQGLTRNGCTGNEVMKEYSEAPFSEVTWTAPSQIGVVTFRAAYAPNYGEVKRSQTTVEVIANEQSNPICATTTSPVASPTQAPESSIGSECSKYAHSKNIGKAFQLCWTLNSDSTDIMLTHPDLADNHWIGLGIGPQMIGSNVVIGYSENGTPSTKTFKPSSKTTDWQVSENNDLGFTDMEYIRADGETLVKFSVPSSNEEPDLVAAYGQVSANPQFRQHTVFRSVKQNLLTGVTISQPLPNALIAHATLMVLGWGLLLPAGFLMARYGKDKFPPVEGGSKLGWFEYHKYIQVSGLFLVTIGFIIGLVKGSKTNIPHMAIGITVSLLGLWQPLNAKFRPHKKKGPVQEPKRVYWEYLHKGSGYMAILLGFTNIGIGLSIALKY